MEEENMRNFWSYIKNNKYRVGCTGGSVYVYDEYGHELIHFRDIPYAHEAALCPNKNILAVKSKDCWLGFYNLKMLNLERKIRLKIPNKPAQDEGFCFSPDGKTFINLETHEDFSFNIVLYDTSSFEETGRYQYYNTSLNDIEFSRQENCYLLLGFRRAEPTNYYFVAKFSEGKIIDEKALEENSFWYLCWYKRIERSGYTKHMIDSTLPEQKLVHVTLEQAYHGEASDEAIWKFD